MFQQVTENKKQYLNLLLLADEQESMIDRYLERGEMFALVEDDVKTICVVTDEGAGCCELKNLATAPAYQGKGYGKQMLNFLFRHYRSRFHTMLVGTGDSVCTIPFYQKCGFAESYRVKNFFLDNYDHAIFEGGKQLTDMLYLIKDLRTD
ncbi:MAG: GNAT family N-acetyltransferase [Ruthenibacterium sp.]